MATDGAAEQSLKSAPFFMLCAALDHTLAAITTKPMLCRLLAEFPAETRGVQVDTGRGKISTFYRHPLKGADRCADDALVVVDRLLQVDLSPQSKARLQAKRADLLRQVDRPAEAMEALVNAIETDPMRETTSAAYSPSSTASLRMTERGAYRGSNRLLRRRLALLDKP